MAGAYFTTASTWVEFLAMLVAFLLSTEVAIRAEGGPREVGDEEPPTPRRWWATAIWYAVLLFALDDAPTFGWGGSRGLYGFGLIVASTEISIVYGRRHAARDERP